MANPQKEHGYTVIANELLDALCAIKLSGHEWSVVHAIMRKTYGYNKKEDRISNSQIMKLTGQTRRKCSQAKIKLIEKKIVTENGDKISINKDYETWKVSPKTVTVVTENGDKVSPKTVTTKEKKEILKKYTSQSSELLSIKKNKNMKKNSWRYSENGDSADFETAIDIDTNTELDADYEKEEKRRKKTRLLANRFHNMCIDHIGSAPVTKPGVAHKMSQQALDALEDKHINKLMQEWFKSGKPKEDLIQITQCFSSNNINRYIANHGL
jgi:phage replication O-like protein O